MADDHPFGRLTGGEGYRDRMNHVSNVAFEEGKVRFLLGAFKLNVTKTAARLRRAEEACTGRSDLTLRAFDEVFPSFPVRLGATRLDGVKLHLSPAAMLPALFRSFTGAPFVAAYEKFYETHGDRTGGRPLGLVFPRKGLKHGLVMYTADDPYAIPLGDREAFLCYVGGNKKDRHWMVVRSFQRLVEAVHNKGHGWRP